MPMRLFLKGRRYNPSCIIAGELRQLTEWTHLIIPRASLRGTKQSPLGWRILHVAYPLLAAGGPVTFVATKVTKKASAERLLCRTRPLPCKSRQNHGLQLFCPTSFTQPLASAKTCYAPAAALSHHVLPAFIRSLSAD
jgi:hypothetical protein